MADKSIGKTDVLYGKHDGIPWNLFAIKEPNYTMKIMVTYGGLTVPPGQKNAIRTTPNRRVVFKLSSLIFLISPKKFLQADNSAAP